MTGRPKRPVLLQLWTVRKELAADFEGTIARLAGMGLTGVEPFNNPAVPFLEQARIIRGAGLSLPAAHLPLPAGETLEKSLAAARALGVEWLVSGFGPEHFTSEGDIIRTAELANEAAENATAAGFGFALHNHWWEFGSEPPVWDTFLSRLDGSVKFELDTYWAQVAGQDPVRLLDRLGERVPLVHLKDGPAVKDEPMLALGDGVLDVDAIVAAASADWLIIELDEFAGDMLAAVSDSVAYLKRLQGD